MKKTIQFALLFAAFFLPFACGKQSPDKQAQLDQLKDQRTQIETQIIALEKELGSAAGTPQRVKIVGLTEVNPTVFRHFIDLQGKIDAEDNVAATAKMPGTLTRIYVKNGDVVKRGQLLAQIDDDIMRRSLSEVELQLKTAEDLYNRQKGLWDQKIGTEIQYIQAKSNKEAMEQRIATTKEQLGQTRIYAPIGGTVDYVVLKIGQAISPGMPLCNILNLSNLKIQGEAPEVYASKVRQGDQVNVYFPDLKKEITTKVKYVSKSINTTNRTFTVECLLPQNADYRANMIAVMKIVDYQKPNAITVPVNVIQTAEDGDFVLIADKTGDKQATARKAPIKQGNNYNGEVEILSGLKKGDQVITTGFQEVNNGEKISF